jgi:hypothetical protein
LFAACVALVVCVWFAIGIRQASDLDEATAIVSQSPSPTKTELAHAASLLSSAGTLNPDLEVNLVRAQVARLENDPSGAIRIAEGVVRDEPQNLEAWYTLAQLGGDDRRILVHALGEITKLDPPPPRTG